MSFKNVHWYKSGYDHPDAVRMHHTLSQYPPTSLRGLNVYRRKRDRGEGGKMCRIYRACKYSNTPNNGKCIASSDRSRPNPIMLSANVLIFAPRTDFHFHAARFRGLLL